RHRVALDRDVTQRVRTWHRVIHEARRQELAATRLIGDLFHQDLADTLRYTPVNLAGQHQGIDDGADVVDHKIRLQLHRTGFRIDLDLAHVTAVRIGRLLRRVSGALDQPRRQAFRQTRGQK